MHKNYIYHCEDSFEGILTGIYEAFYSGLPKDTITLMEGSFIPTDLFAEVADVPVNIEKAKKVSDSITAKLSTNIYELVYKVSQAGFGMGDIPKSQMIYLFLQKAFRTGKSIINDLGDADILHMDKLSKMVSMEQHRTMQFVHFKQLEGNMLFAQIQPKHHQLLLIAEHFEDRYPNENFILYDKLRKCALVHQAQMPSFIYNDFPIELLDTTTEDCFIDLWKAFFNAIGIEERKNINLQKAHVPKRFRRNMAEYTAYSKLRNCH